MGGALSYVLFARGQLRGNGELKLIRSSRPSYGQKELITKLERNMLKWTTYSRPVRRT